MLPPGAVPSTFASWRALADAAGLTHSFYCLARAGAAGAALATGAAGHVLALGAWDAASAAVRLPRAACVLVGVDGWVCARAP